jgi:hypothetical protein
VTVHGYTVRSPLTGYQVTSKPCDRFSRYLKWLDTFRTALLLHKIAVLASKRAKSVCITKDKSLIPFRKAVSTTNFVNPINALKKTFNFARMPPVNELT